MKKKKILLIATACFLIFASKSIYWYLRNDCNNLSLILSNYITCRDGEDKSVTIEVYIDDQLYYRNSAFSEPYLFVDYKSVSIGYHRLKVIVNSRFVATEDFFVFPMKWIVIECWGSNGVINDIMLWFYESPPGLM